MTDVKDSLNRFLNSLPDSIRQAEYDAEWEPLCKISQPNNEGYICWQPVPMEVSPDFSKIEKTLGIHLHQDIKDLYGSYWYGSTEAQHSGECVLLPTLWNQQALEFMFKGIIDHVRCRREEFPELADSIFIASTDSSFFFSVNNETGEVMLEEPGYPPIKTVASSLSAFLNEL